MINGRQSKCSSNYKLSKKEKKKNTKILTRKAFIPIVQMDKHYEIVGFFTRIS